MNSEGSDSCNRSSNLTQIEVKIVNFSARLTFKFNGWPYKQQDTCSMLCQALSLLSWPSVNLNWCYSPEAPNCGQNRRFFLYLVTLKFDRWPWKTIGHLFYATSSFVHNFIAIYGFKLELQSGNSQIGAQFVLTSATCFLVAAKKNMQLSHAYWLEINQQGI